MKKLMFAAAAIAAGVAVADVTSANIVGYQQVNVQNQGNTMIAPTFANVGITGKFNLNDISMTGYDPSEYDGEEWDGGAKRNQLILQTLTKGGVVDQQYFWLDYINGDNPDPTSEENDVFKGWYKYVGGKYVQMTNEERLAAEFDQGQAFWILSGLKKVVKLVPVGAVGKADVAFAIETQGNTAVGNSRPVAITLGELTASGYDPSEYDGEEWDGGAKRNQLILQTLTKGGVVDKQYFWLDYINGEDPDPTSEENDVFKGWYKYVGGKYIQMTQKELDEEEFDPGQGFWFLSGLKKAGVKFNVPAVKID